MKNILLLTAVLVCTALIYDRAQAQCVDAVGIDTCQYNSGLFLISGWEVNEFPGAHVRFLVRPQFHEMAYSIAPFTPVIDHIQNDSCNGGILAHLIDEATIPAEGYYEYMVIMVNYLGQEFRSGIETAPRQLTRRRYQWIARPRNISVARQTVNVSGNANGADLARITNHFTVRQQVEIFKAGLRTIALRNAPANYEIMVIDMMGRVVMSRDMSGQTELELDLVSGLYIVSVVADGQAYGQKIVLE